MSLSNTAVPIYYGEFREKVLLTGLSAAAVVAAWKATSLVQQKWIEHLVKDVRLTDILDVSLH